MCIILNCTTNQFVQFKQLELLNSFRSSLGSLDKALKCRVQRTISAAQWESYVWLWFGCSWYSLDPKNSYTPKSTRLTKSDTYRLQEVNLMINVLLISLGQSFMTYILIVPKGKHWFCFWIKIPSRERVFWSYWNVISICRKYREKRLNPFRFCGRGQ